MVVPLLANFLIEHPRDDMVVVATADCGAGGQD